MRFQIVVVIVVKLSTLANALLSVTKSSLYWSSLVKTIARYLQLKQFV